MNGVIVAGLYLPIGNPRPGAEFNHKLAWFERLIKRTANLLASGVQVVLAGGFNVMRTERDVYKPERWLEDALFAPEVRALYVRLRIDHLLLSPALAGRLIDAQVDRQVRSWEKTSDHAPVWIKLADSWTQRCNARVPRICCFRQFQLKRRVWCTVFVAGKPASTLWFVSDSLGNFRGSCKCMPTAASF